MIRYVIRQGCRISSGGIVTEGHSQGPFLGGVPVSFIGAAAACHACGHTGVIAADGPRGALGEGNFNGRTLALSGDLVLCRCPTPPRVQHDCEDWRVAV
ncbi:hypothetical protein [uncultured Aquitalea sp.]|uniref:hypothetical protein n=1 Tax=uncultured Aquitalea sp. TaxID=540272 RepID=UPI0025CBC080|nr:hypothetical protein [uncultured Aquitalea sp.]